MLAGRDNVQLRVNEMINAFGQSKGSLLYKIAEIHGSQDSFDWNQFCAMVEEVFTVFLVPAEDVDDEDDDLVLRVAQDMFPYSDSGLNDRLDSPSHDEFERSTVQDQAGASRSSTANFWRASSDDHFARLQIMEASQQAQQARMNDAAEHILRMEQTLVEGFDHQLTESESAPT